MTKQQPEDKEPEPGGMEPPDNDSGNNLIVKVIHQSKLNGLPISCTLGPRLDAVITRSNFKSEAIFGFLSPKYTGHVT